MIIAQHLTVDQIALLLACMEEVNITDAADLQWETKAQLCRALKRKVPEHFNELVGLGKFTDNSERLNKSQRVVKSGSTE